MKKPSKVTKETSCGVILYHKYEKNYEFLLLHYPSGHWDFPKGHKEEGESDIQTALRELEEETGINDVEINDGFREIMHYDFRRGNELVKKDVIYFVGEASDKDVEISHEHKNFIWLPFKEAYERITFQNAKDLLKKANDFLMMKQTTL